MKKLFKKTIVLALVAALGVAALPFVSVAAAGQNDPPAPQGQLSNDRLERVWARQLRIYERIGDRFEHADSMTTRLQNLINRAAQNGKDLSAVQSALDAFEAALPDAKSAYESAESMVDTHQGFDDSGKVTDTETARATVQALREKFKAVHDAMNGTGKALLEALRDFREANPRPVPTPTS